MLEKRRSLLQMGLELEKMLEEVREGAPVLGAKGEPLALKLEGAISETAALLGLWFRDRVGRAGRKPSERGMIEVEAFLARDAKRRGD